MVKNGEIKVKASTHSTRISLDRRGLEYDIAELTVDKIWTRSGQWIESQRLEFMNLDVRAGDRHGRVHAGRDSDDERGLA